MSKQANESKRFEFDYSKLRGKIIEKYKTRYEFAKALGISNSSLSAFLNNRRTLRISTIKKMVKLLEIPDSQVGEYFFKL